MRNHVREVKKVAEELMANGEIEAFSFGHDKKHHLIEFRVSGRWMSVPVSRLPSIHILGQLRTTTDQTTHPSHVATLA